MKNLDFIVMVIFALLIFCIGLVFTRKGSKSGQAFFEAGGETPWWINGLSLFISYFSAGTFVVWGSIAYKHGLVANAIQLTMAISGLIVALFIAARWKRTGAKTAAEYLGKRFGLKAQQFYTYLILVLSLFSTASVLYPVGKMVYVATPFSLEACIITIGLIIVLYTAAGGLWAVLVTDVVQFVILTASVLIVIPIAFNEIGGAGNLLNQAPENFFQPFNEDYTLGFMLAFIVYQTLYIGGNWSYVQRYTSVATEKNSRKVAYLFTILYFISPFLWMIPPMIFRIMSPDLKGLESEGAYMMLCQKILPAGLIGLVLAGMISATSSKANTTINLAATVFATDLYKNLIRPKAAEKELIFVARIFTLLFGICTIILALLIPLIGGIVEFVLSLASIAGGALFAPIIWSLFSKRQTGISLVTTSTATLLINLFFKTLSPSLFGIKLNRAVETGLGVGLPLLILLFFELYYACKGRTHTSGYIVSDNGSDTNKSNRTEDAHREAEKQNIFGIRVISLSMLVVGVGIIILGLLANDFSWVVISVGSLILIIAAFVWKAAHQRSRMNVMFIKKTVLLLCLFLSSQFYAKAQQEKTQRLWYNKPSEEWLQALPMGNGFIGAMVYGGVAQEHIQFNELSLCTGTTSSMGWYQPFGDLYLDFSVSDFSNYKRELLLNDAIHKITYQVGDVQFTREYFISYPDQVMVMRIWASKPGQITGKVRLKDAHQGTIIVEGNEISASGRLENNMAYESRLKLQIGGGELKSDTSGISVIGASRLTLYLVAGTSFVNDHRQNFQGEHPHRKLVNRMATLSKKTYKQLKRTHVTDFRKHFNRVELNLGNTPRKSTTDRLLEYNKGVSDPALEVLLFQYGRYLLISSSRPGGLPANLQGIWNDSYKPEWYSQYTTNINIQMNYWPAEVTNLPECHSPLFKWVENLAAVQKKSSDPKLKTPFGWIAYSTNNLMGGPSTWGIHRPGSAWLSQHFWEHFAFNRDTSFLRTSAFPMLKDVVAYWENHLVEGPKGFLITPDGWSPEHGPGMKEGDRTPYPGVSYDQQIVYDLFTNFIEASELLKEDSAHRLRIISMRDRLLGPQIGRWGQLQEWMDDVDDPNDKHRHNSHLFAVHPGRQISPFKTPELAKAALVSLNARGDKSTGWSTAWKINLYARLQESNRSYELIRQLFRQNILHNLFDTHPPFQIDGNFGYTAGVAEMLLQSHAGSIHLLPALPSVWKNGFVKGLKARGNVEVAVYWKNGQLEKVILKAAKSGTYRIRYANREHTIELVNGKPYQFNNLF
ncbi:sodium:solute symporter family transporter [Flavihumibacter sp. UBA7668]|uniref:sodium:solute symporter family transporter n=1 Tax=Flavihumibacter sp. UBA7668 TaxID=1946542 RepID=UPI0025C3CABD|nr:sodium/solute symporter [Flavihumibacter sp. UBA7668]